MKDSFIEAMAGKTIYLFVVILLLSSVLFVGHWTSGHNWGGDFSTYIMQAMSIINGTTHEFIVSNSFTVNESSRPMGPIAYPWGFPLLLAPIYMFFGMNFYAFKIIGLLFFIGFLITLWFGFKTLLNPFERLIFVSLFAFNPFLLRFGDNILSDIPFLFFSTLCIAILLYKPIHFSLLRDRIFALTLGIATAATISIRTNGIFIIFIIVILLSILSLNKSKTVFDIDHYIKNLYYKYDKKNLLLLFIIFSLSLIIPLIITQIMLPNGQSDHLTQCLSLINIKMITSNLYYYINLTKVFFGIGIKYRIISYSTYLISILFVIYGLKFSWKITFPAILYSFLTLALYIVYPATQGLRYIFPILPFYIFYMIIGFRNIPFLSGNWRFIKYIPTALLAVLFLVVSINSMSLNLEKNRIPPYGPFTTSAVEMLDYIKNNTNTDEIIVFKKPRVMRLFTGRESLNYLKASDFKYFDLIVLDKKYHLPYFKNELYKLSKKFKLEKKYENSNYVVYRKIK